MQLDICTTASSLTLPPAKALVAAGACDGLGLTQASPALLPAGGLRLLCPAPPPLLLTPFACAPFCQLRAWGAASPAARGVGCASASGVRSRVAESRWAMASLAAVSSAAALPPLPKCTESAKRACRRPALSVNVMTSSKRLTRLATGTLASDGRGMREAAAAASAAGESLAGVCGVSDGSGMRAAAAAAAAARVALVDPTADERPVLASHLLPLPPRLRRADDACVSAGDAGACKLERSDGCWVGVGAAEPPGTPPDIVAAGMPPPKPPDARSDWLLPNKFRCVWEVLPGSSPPRNAGPEGLDLGPDETASLVPCDLPCPLHQENGSWVMLRLMRRLSTSSVRQCHTKAGHLCLQLAIYTLPVKASSDGPPLRGCHPPDEGRNGLRRSSSSAHDDVKYVLADGYRRKALLTPSSRLHVVQT